MFAREGRARGLTLEDYRGGNGAEYVTFRPERNAGVTLEVSLYEIAGTKVIQGGRALVRAKNVEWHLRGAAFLLEKGRASISTEDPSFVLDTVLSDTKVTSCIERALVAGDVALRPSYLERLTESQRNNLGGLAQEIASLLERYGMQPTTEWRVKKK